MPEKTHWKQLVNPDFIGAYALGGQDLTLTIATVKRERIVGAQGKSEECTVVYWKEDYKPFICNRTNAKTISKVHGTPYIEDWAGKRITLYPSTTKFGGELVECLRVRPNKPADNEPVIACEKCGKPIRAAGRMSAEQVAAYAKTKYGKALCAACGKELSENSAPNRG